MARQLNERVQNLVENLACRVARRHGGRLAPGQLLPYLPMSLALLKDCLDEMADGTAVTADLRGAMTEYDFSAYHERPAPTRDVAGEPLRTETCLSCDADLPTERRELLCDACRKMLRKALDERARTDGWPAQAVYEHEIFHHAAQLRPPIVAEDLAADTRYTLRSIREKLDALTAAGYVAREMDARRGVMRYTFPALSYSREAYRANMAVIREYPASALEDVETTVTRILMTWGVMILVMLVLAFCRVPFPLLMAAFVISAIVSAVVIWRRRATDNPKEI